MDRAIERLSRAAVWRPTSRRGFIGVLGRVAAGTGLAVLGMSASEQPAEAYIDCWDGDPLMDFGWFDPWDYGFGWIDIGDFGYPMVDPLDLQSPAQERVDRCVRTCVGGRTGVEGYLVRVECEDRCTRAEIQRVQRQQRRRLRTRRRPTPRPRGIIRCL